MNNTPSIKEAFQELRDRWAHKCNNTEQLNHAGSGNPESKMNETEKMHEKFGVKGDSDQSDITQKDSESVDLLALASSKKTTFGRKAVGITFNPGGNFDVDHCKSMCADLIDQMNDLRNKSSSSEQKRLSSIAITELQGAQMWAVKAITWKD